MTQCRQEEFLIRPILQLLFSIHFECLATKSTVRQGGGVKIEWRTVDFPKVVSTEGFFGLYSFPTSFIANISYLATKSTVRQEGGSRWNDALSTVFRQCVISEVKFWPVGHSVDNTSWGWVRIEWRIVDSHHACMCMHTVQIFSSQQLCLTSLGRARVAMHCPCLPCAPFPAIFNGFF